jgi:hypothetical protein
VGELRTLYAATLAGVTILTLAALEATRGEPLRVAAEVQDAM